MENFRKRQIFSLLLLLGCNSLLFAPALAEDIVMVKGKRYERVDNKLYPQQNADWTDLQGVVHPSWVTDFSSWIAPDVHPNFQPQKPNFKASSSATEKKPEPPPFSVVDSGKKHLVTIGADALFDFDKASLTPKSEKVLASLGPVLKKYGNCSVTIAGHTDSIGTDEYNQDLSERRAQTVRDWLAAHQYVAADAPVTGFGKRQPIALNALADGKDYPPGRAKNRRVEITLETIETASAEPPAISQGN